MDVLQVAKEIEKYCDKIASLLTPINELGIAKANALGDYEQAIQIAELRLKDDGIAVTLIKGQSRGLCRDKRIACDIAESAYKAQIVKIEAAKAILNAKQSIYRHLDNTGR